MRPSLRRVLLVLVLTAVASLAGGVAAGAHTELLGSDPADGANVATSPAQVTLTFSQNVQVGFSAITVVGPDGTQFQDGAAVERGPTVSVPVRPLPAPGEYTTGYRVLSADGHPVTGSIRFVFSGSPTQAAAPTPTTAPDLASAPSTTVASDRQDGSGPSWWPWALGIVGLIAVGVITARSRVL